MSNCKFCKYLYKIANYGSVETGRDRQTGGQESDHIVVSLVPFQLRNPKNIKKHNYKLKNKPVT